VFHVIKKATSLAAQSHAFEKSVNLLENVDKQRPGLLRVLTYHRVDELGAHPWLDPELISATPEGFEDQVRFLASHYQVLSVSDVIEVFESGNSRLLPAHALLVTFDDAYSDFEEHAWPILKHYGIPATLFVPTAYPDQPERTFWWDDLYQAIQTISQKAHLNTPIGSLSMSNTYRIKTYGQLRSYLKTLKHTEAIAKVKQLCNEVGIQPANNSILGWESLRKLTSEGLALGAHTRTHALMNRISLEDVREEAIGSLRDLERETGLALPIFAYPSGEVSSEVIKVLEREGFVLGFAMKRGINNISHTDPLRIGRINIGRGTTRPILGARLLSWTAHLNWLQTPIKV
jgi:peptidoglycan/xylan/chitin deacetylase (PgdA/CDA1 family)